jgi:hypothetical protein
VVYAEGKAGTTQEIFQDAAQNYYRSFGYFSPMVLLGVDYWSKTLPVTSVLEPLIGEADFKRYVLLTNEIDAAAKHIEDFVPG